jgi:ABC-type lipoprotein release transport system permease subunit
MRRTPVFLATVILTVALAIVANTTIFSVVNSVLLVFGVNVRDARTFALVVVTLAIVTVAACAIPALRASRVSPLVVLRYE